MPNESKTLGNKLSDIFAAVIITTLVLAVTVTMTLAMAWFSINIFFDIHHKLYGF